MIIPRSLYEEMLTHAREPIEACGILGGRDGRAEVFHPTANAEESPVRYSIAPPDLFRITRELDRAGLDLLAIFHSHPATEAYPSATDVRLAFYPDAFYLIMSLVDPERPVLRAFRIVEGVITEAPLTIVGGVIEGGL